MPSKLFGIDYATISESMGLSATEDPQQISFKAMQFLRE